MGLAVVDRAPDEFLGMEPEEIGQSYADLALLMLGAPRSAH